MCSVQHNRYSPAEASRNLANARAYIRRLLREGRLTEPEADSQLQAVDHAALTGRRVLIVRDIEHTTTRRRQHAA
jgi:hypothetical protein